MLNIYIYVYVLKLLQRFKKYNQNNYTNIVYWLWLILFKFVSIVGIKTWNYFNELICSYWTLDETVWLWMYCNRLAHDQYIFIYIWFIYIYFLYLFSACIWLDPNTCQQINSFTTSPKYCLPWYKNRTLCFQLRESSRALIHFIDLSSLRLNILCWLLFSLPLYQ